MLSERREKQKWSIDPNGTNWRLDSNKFGTKMLEKMGWTQGKGLGANEDGCTEHVKVKKKNDLRGVGCSVKEVHNWVAHQDAFSNLLAELNDHHSDAKDEKVNDVKGVSNLEKHSKSQKRVHYHKFARGKNLSNYGDNDLAAIFGKRSAQSAPTTPINLSEGESSGTDSASSCPVKKKKKRKLENSCDKDQTNRVTSSMSVQEYFAKRMAEIKGKKSQSISIQESCDRNLSNPDRTQRGNGVINSSTESRCQDNDEYLTKRKNKRKKLGIPEDEETTESSKNSSMEPISDKQRKKKKKRKLKKQEDDSESNSMATVVKKKPKKRQMSGESTTLPKFRDD